MNAVFFFDKMITPKIITFVYWLMLLGAVIGGLKTMFGGGGATMFFIGLIGMIGGVVGARIFCELMIVAFKMNEALQDIRNK